MELRSHESAVRTDGGIVNGARLITEQESEARITVRIETTSWDGTSESAGSRSTSRNTSIRESQSL